jgi:hypothetical protein
VRSAALQKITGIHPSAKRYKYSTYCFWYIRLKPIQKTPSYPWRTLYLNISWKLYPYVKNVVSIKRSGKDALEDPLKNTELTRIEE